MSVRAIDNNGDWIYGIGRSAYISGKAQVAQSIQTRLLSFLGDCFFDMGAGIDWFNELGSKDQIGLNLAISAVILNTGFVTSINEISVSLDSKRNFRLQYTVNTSFGVVSNTIITAQTVSGNALLTESGSIFITENGTVIITE